MHEFRQTRLESCYQEGSSSMAEVGLISMLPSKKK